MAKKKKSSKKAAPDAIAMKLKAPKDNPFETIWSRRKFDILGKKRKGEQRRIGQARSLAIEKRKKTLLKEYEQSGKASVFLDKRIGEQNDALGEFDKAILRSQRERQIKTKKNKYNLSDGEEDEFEIVPGRDDFNEEVEPYENDLDDADHFGDRKRLDILKQLNTSAVEKPSDDAAASEGEENRPKSKKEVMEEVIQKSKFFKAQKAKDKEENEQLIDQLDKDFSSLIQSEALLSLTQPTKVNALKALVNPSISKGQKKDAISVTESGDSSKQDQPDSYDKMLKEMTLEMRARPSDRTKTPEEIAEEERERLERLEEERQKRMLATDASDEEDASEDGGSPRVQISRHISGDDLGDSFSVEEKPKTKKGWVDEILERNKEDDSDNEEEDDDDDASEGDEDDEEETDGEGENEEDEETLKDWEQSDDDLDVNVGEDDEEDGGSDEAEQSEEMKKRHKMDDDLDRLDKKEANLSASKKRKTAAEQPSNQESDLPFKINAPSSIDELLSLLRNHSNENIVEAIRRIRAYNAISLAAENRKKMQVFYGLLLQYFATLANQKPPNFELLNLLLKPLMEMSSDIPYFAAICARERIFRTRTKFCEDIKDPEKSCWPSLKTLILLRLWSMIFPCSDFRHAVMTPAILLMCEYLMRCPILSGRDAAVGSFLCSMVLSVTKQSQKFCPEALMFLKALLMAAMDRDQRSCQNSQKFDHFVELKVPKSLLCLQAHIEEIDPLNFLEIMDLPEDSSFFSSDGFRASVLVSVVETLKGFVDIYGELKAFPQIFLPISALLLEVVKQQNIPGVLQDKLNDLAGLITRKADEHQEQRQPLQMRKQKPEPIKFVELKFEENYVKGRDYDPDRERAELRKLKKLWKQEAKGAAREIRKDNYFLADVKEKERQRMEEERAERYGKARAFLQEQEHAFKSGQLGKGRKRRR